MNAIANSPEFSKKAGVPQSVGMDFVKSDKAKGKFKSKAKRRYTHPSNKVE